MARNDPQFLLRVPQDVRDWLKQRSVRTQVSMNAEIVKSIRARMTSLDRKSRRAEPVSSAGPLQ
ncbi:Arc family DNA-binding protein [Bradyrhizobium sp. GCM10023182]|uniref:Arc family DNA-binding protein n=1 Tax=Bradyrhizobium zhengyangense TaxID=2911009 RepID=A0ABS9M227_9BRAD|nr:Arc family DNA-binding protein [Bradyrhizobium zhengyangense]MCG2673342.1 Arc family DNA-binding protein [Bradyrhizobium zhengyangense]